MCLNGRIRKNDEYVVTGDQARTARAGARDGAPGYVGQRVYNVDARYATEGTADMIERRLKKFSEDEAPKLSPSSGRQARMDNRA